jgi:hypothetical protein
MLFAVPAGYGPRSNSIRQSVWIVIQDSKMPERLQEGSLQTPADMRVRAAVWIGTVPACYDADGKLWQCTQTDLTDAGAFLLCDLLDNLEEGLSASIYTLAETASGTQTVSIN